MCTLFIHFTDGILEEKRLSSQLQLIGLLIHAMNEGTWVVGHPPPAGKQQLLRVLTVSQGYQPHHHGGVCSLSYLNSSYFVT